MIVLLLTEITKEGEGQGDTNSTAFCELQGLRNQKEKIEASYGQIFPKVDPNLVHDLVLRMYQDPVKNKNKGPMYTVEVFTKVGTDSQKFLEYMIKAPTM
jgi:hypothetical protein